MGFGCDGTQQSMSINVNPCQSMSININQWQSGNPHTIHMAGHVMGFGRGSEQHGQKML
jgi:hypothetical protein